MSRLCFVSFCNKIDAFIRMIQHCSVLLCLTLQIKVEHFKIHIFIQCFIGCYGGVCFSNFIASPFPEIKGDDLYFCTSFFEVVTMPSEVRPTKTDIFSCGVSITIRNELKSRRLRNEPCGTDAE